MVIKVLYAGDSSGLITWYYESPFLIDFKEFKYYDVGKPLTKALEQAGDIKVVRMMNWDAYERFPSTIEELKEYDVVILSDIEAEILLLHPIFYHPEEWKGIVKIPNRVKELVKWIKEGGGLIFAGSWVTFVGRYGRGLWWRTPLGDVLPVKLKVELIDDRVECPEGAYVKALKPEHPVMEGIPWEECPPFLGYNEVEATDRGEVLATISPEGEERKDPFIVVGEYHKGRVLVFTSDPVPHWGINFVRWKYYSKFWQQAVRWSAGQI